MMNHWLSYFHLALVEVRVVKLQDIVSNNFYWEQLTCGPAELEFPSSHPFKDRSCFRLALAVRWSVSSVEQAHLCLCTVYSQVSLNLCLPLTFLSSESHPRILFVYPSSWPHRRCSQAWRDPINHGVQIKSQIIIMENNGFHVNFSSAWKCFHTIHIWNHWGWKLGGPAVRWNLCNAVVTDFHGNKSLI